MDAGTLFGRRLRQLRKQRGFTQEKLGVAAGLSYKYLGGVERGEENPTLAVVAKLADALKVEPRDLFEYRHEATTPAQLRKELDHLTREADVATLRQAVKLLRALLV
jgi:transcriptional regulator with XRE-family HTH domain